MAATTNTQRSTGVTIPTEVLQTMTTASLQNLCESNGLATPADSGSRARGPRKRNLVELLATHFDGASAAPAESKQDGDDVLSEAVPQNQVQQPITGGQQLNNGQLDSGQQQQLALQNQMLQHQLVQLGHIASTNNQSQSLGMLQQHPSWNGQQSCNPSVPVASGYGPSRGKSMPQVQPYSPFAAVLSSQGPNQIPSYLTQSYPSHNPAVGVDWRTGNVNQSQLIYQTPEHQLLAYSQAKNNKSTIPLLCQLLQRAITSPDMRWIPDDRFYNAAANTRDYEIFRRYPWAFFIVIGFTFKTWSEKCQAAGGNIMQFLRAMITILLAVGSFIRGKHHELICRYLEMLFRTVASEPVTQMDLLAAHNRVFRCGIFDNNKPPSDPREVCALWQTGSCGNKPCGSKKSGKNAIERGPCAYRHWCVLCEQPGHGMLFCLRLPGRLKNVKKTRPGHKPRPVKTEAKP